MTREAQQPHTISPAELMQAAEAVARHGRKRLVRIQGKPLAIVPERASGATSSLRHTRARVVSREELQQVLAETHGAWRALIDPEEFKRQRRELQRDDRDPRTL